ncbi:urease accessory protein ureD, partial [Sulfitobacter sp. HI0082]
MVSAKAARGGSTLGDLRQSGAMKLLFPRPDPAMLQAIIINSAGGITGGDSFALTARAEAKAALSLTTQAAERAYRAQPGQVANLRNTLAVDSGATLHWLPQETILYDGCALRRRLSVDLAQDASLLLVEPLVFGRAAMGETLRQAHFRDRIEVSRVGRPLFHDAMTLSGDVTAHLAAPHIAAGAGALAT